MNTFKCIQQSQYYYPSTKIEKEKQIIMSHEIDMQKNVNKCIRKSNPTEWDYSYE